MKTATKTLLLAGASLRLSRLVTSDWLGEWTLVRPAKAWSDGHEEYALTFAHPNDCPIQQGADSCECLGWYNPVDPLTWQAKLTSALDCPFCVGFWITLGIFTLEQVTRGVPRGVRSAGRVAATALAVNYVAGHISAKIDA